MRLDRLAEDLKEGDGMEVAGFTFEVKSFGTSYGGDGTRRIVNLERGRRTIDIYVPFESDVLFEITRTKQGETP